MSGEQKYAGKNHIVLLGSTKGTIPMMEQILMDESGEQRDIIIVAEVDKHTMPDKKKVYYVQTLNNANIEFADRVIIHIGENENNSPVLMNTLKLKKESCEVVVECLSDKSFDALTSIPGDFGVIMQMTTEMIMQAIQNKVHIPMQILTQNDRAEDIFFITIPDSANYNQHNGQGWQWRELLQYLKEKYNYLAFAIKPVREKVLMSPADDTNIPKGCSIWLLAEKRPVNINWKNIR